MSSKKFVIATIVVFLFIVIFDYIFHAHYLHDMYIQTAHLWRPEAEMQNFFAWLTFGQFIIAVAFVVLFVFAFTQKGISQGLTYGFLVGVIFMGNLFIGYAVTPYPLTLLINWIVGTFIECIIAGLIVGFICKSN